MTLTPSGGTSNLPALVNGTPGLPPVFDSVTVTQVPYGTTPPASTITTVSPGGAGTASHYTLQLYVQEGQQGATGPSTTISTAPDVTGGPVGSSTNGDTLYYTWTGSSGSWVISPPKVPSGPYIALSSAFSAYSGTATATTIATIGTPALPYAWRPLVFGAFYATGTVNTQIASTVTLGSTSGQQVAYGMGHSGAGTFAVHTQPSFGGSVSGTSYGQVAANTTASFLFQALQLNSTTDTWSTSTTSANFTIWAIPT